MRLAASLVAALLSALAAPVASSAPRAARGVVEIGMLPRPPAESVNQGQVVQIDAARRKLFYTYLNEADGLSTWLVEYDLRSPIPRFTRTGRVGAPNEIPTSSPYSTALDSKRDRLLFMRPNQAGENSILVVDTEKLETEAVWSLTQSVPGFLPMGMTFSAQDDRVYLIGEMTQSVVLGSSVTGHKAVGPGTAIVAVDAEDGALAWATPLPECQQALYRFGLGSLIARSASRPALHVACTTGGSGRGDALPGQAGLIRVTVDPDAAPQDAPRFRREFFPISGSYFSGTYTGIAAFDPGTDRFFMQSLAPTTPGAWVFDSRLSAWVGFVAAPDAKN